MKEEKRIIEIGGVKLEVDLRHAKQIDSYKVGDNVKVLVKEYGDKYSSFPGIILGFDNFEKRPTILVAYLKVEYNSAKITMIYLNQDSADVEICPMLDNTPKWEKAHVVDLLDRELNKKEQELLELKAQKEYFLNNFNKYFGE